MRNGWRHILWDWNGTLMADTWLCVEVLNGILREEGRPTLDEAYYREHFDFPVIRFYEKLGFTFDEAAFEAMSHVFVDRYNARRTECALHPRTEETLAALGRAGYTQSILSAYEAAELPAVIAHYGLVGYFNALVGAPDRKAGSKVGRARDWMAKSDLEPREVVMAGDTVHDFEVAEAIGAHGVLLAHGHHNEERLAATGAPVFAGLEALAQYLGADRPAVGKGA